MTRDELEQFSDEDLRAAADAEGIDKRIQRREKLIDAMAEDAAPEVEMVVEDAPPPIMAPKATQTYNPAAPVPTIAAPSRQEIEDALKNFIARGLQLDFTRHDENTITWLMKIGNKEACGNIKMPLSQIVWQANLIMAPTATPIEGEDLDTIVKLRASRAR